MRGIDSHGCKQRLDRRLVEVVDEFALLSTQIVPAEDAHGFFIERRD